MATTPVRSMDIGRVLSTGFNALSKNAVAFLGVSLVLSGIPGFAMQYWLLGVATQEPSLELVLSWQFWAPILGSIVVGILSATILQGTLIGATVRHLSGRPVDIGQNVSAALARIISIILVSLLIGIAVVFGLLLLIVPGIIFYLMYVVAIPVMMAEGRGVTDSMSRSSELTKGSRPMIFLLLIIMGMVSGAVSAVCNAIFGRIAEVSGDAAADLITLSLGATVSSTITSAFSAVIIAALYIELRNVKEGASTEEIAGVFA